MLKQVRVAALAVALAMTVGLALWGAAVEAQQVGHGARTEMKGTKIAGVDPDSLGRVMKMDEYGRPVIIDGDRDRDLSPIQTIIAAVNLNAGNAVQNNLAAKSLLQYGRGKLLVTWTHAAAADSDSVNILVTVTHKTSTSSGILYNQGIALGSVNAIDSLWAYSTAGHQFVKPVPTYYVTRNSLAFLSISGSLSANPVRFPLEIYRLGASTNGIAIDMGDNFGVASVPDYLMVTVANVHPRKNLTGVQVDFKPRVN